MNILVTLDRNYLEPLHIMLFSLFCNNPGERFAVYMVGDGLLPEDVNNLQKLCLMNVHRINFVIVNNRTKSRTGDCNLCVRIFFLKQTCMIADRQCIFPKIVQS